MQCQQKAGVQFTWPKFPPENLPENQLENPLENQLEHTVKRRPFQYSNSIPNSEGQKGIQNNGLSFGLRNVKSCSLGASQAGFQAIY